MYSVAQTGVVDAYRVPYNCVRSSGSSSCSRSRDLLKIRFRVQSHNSLQVVRDTRKFRSVRLRAQVPGDVSLVTEESFRIGAVPEDVVEDEQVLALGYGWKVREASRFDVEELRAVAQVQASSFHLQTAVFDELFFKIFKRRYACLLAEPAVVMDEGGESGDEPPPTIVGAVNLAASVDNDVLRHLHSASEYLYVSGMAVDPNFRRKNVATLLLRACELLAMKWGFDYLVLHAYEDDAAARTLYARGGYRVIALDPMWMSTWVGRKRRVLMAKRTSRTPTFDF